jgi:transposase
MIDLSKLKTAEQKAAEAAEQAAGQVRAERDSKLAATDWMALSDVTMTPEWAAYRQALRDVTDQVGFPDNVTWPIAQE